MTDKQIIIDGVDVSGCEFLAKKDSYYVRNGINYAYTYKGQCMCSDEEMCEEYPKCFYKKVLKQLKRKEQECERLKEIANNALDKVNNYLDKKEKSLLYKQTLTDIKDICNNNDELKGGFNLVDCDKYKLGKHNLANKILQKISECEVEDANV